MSKSIKIISACVACAAALGLGTVAVLLRKDDKSVPTISKSEETTVPTEATTVAIPENLSELYSYVPSRTGVSERTKSLKRLNKDIMGYIKIDGTQVDYPFVLDPGEVAPNDPYYGPDAYIPDSYYLEKDLFRQYYDRGTLFADYRDTFGSNEAEHSENMVIYGHSWYDGTMMGSLRKYRAGFEFYNQYPFIKLSSNYRDYDYVIFAYLVTSGSYDATDFHYWNMEEIDTEEDFNFYIDCCKRSWGIDTGIDVKYGDQLLTLSTCYADWDNSRFIVVARRLRDGEVAGDLNSVQHTEAFLNAQKEAAENAEKQDEEQPQQ
ncbi:MAG: class B sortase [Ruminococcus sp.]|uniref:class B sortase n=1 Tax=Ruminococcus sp. TaxID=41978 RepID=UPI001B079DAC|nr:class B sortase [Ruminococcus sp.]MBO7475214.1 class B sortase [Ruminococcus sp.]